MSNHERRPPSGRDFAVFEAVILGGTSTREAAEQFRVSQTRVCQLVERVREWQAEVLPAESDSDERRLRLAKILAAGRLDHLYGEMMQAWRRSQGEMKKTRSSRFGDDVTTTFFSPGDPKYALAAMRLATAQAALGVFGGLACPPEEDEEACEAGHSEASPCDTGRPEARPTKDPPIEDCSQNGQPKPAPAKEAASEPAATTSSKTTCGELSPRQAAARERFLGPVQPPIPAGESSQTVTQIQVTPEQLGLSVADILSRQQRRAGRRARRAG
jgi:hypothetical protein